LRYHIDTIPLWDAVKLGGECPLCALRRKNELLDIQRFLGASVMEPDTRIQVNAKGFCGHHLAQMILEKNRLGLALMLHTHMKEKERAVADILAPGKAAGTGLFRKKTRPGTEAASSLGKKAQALAKTAETCVLCDSLTENMNRYAFTLLHLWERDRDFRQAFLQSKGVCLPHGAQLLAMAEEGLSSREVPAFTEALSRLILEGMARISEELEWFTLKFDYRNAEKPWGNSRDALERACNKLRGWCVGEEPHPEE
jgi:hypothetical protein